MGKQQIIPGLGHDPWALGQRPGTMVNRPQNGMHAPPPKLTEKD
jgi:hypothetical protein